MKEDDILPLIASEHYTLYSIRVLKVMKQLKLKKR